MLRVAVLGTGAIVERAHLPTLAAEPGVEIAAVVGRDGARAAALAARFGAREALSDPAEAIGRAEVDAVVVALHNAAHGPLTAQALRAGKHVLCEKPLAIDAASLAEVAAARAAAPAGRVLAVNFNLRGVPAVAAVARAAQDGTFGELRTVRTVMQRSAGAPGLGGWFTRRETAGAGALFDLGSHMADLALWMTGFAPAAAVWGETWADHVPRGRGAGGWTTPPGDGDLMSDVDDRALFGWRTAAGTRVEVDVAWAMHGPDALRLEVVGSRGGAVYAPDATLGGPALTRWREGARGPEATPAETQDGEAARAAWAAGARPFLALCRGQPVEVATFAQAARGLELLLAVRDRRS